MTEEPKPRKESLGERLKAEQMEQGPDGKMRRKVPTVIKVKAFLVIALPILLLLLIGLGFVPMLEDGKTLWQKVMEKFFGEEETSFRGPPRIRRPNEPIDVEKLKGLAKQDDRSSLVSAGLEVEDAIRDLEHGPDTDQNQKQLQELKDTLAEIQKKLSASGPKPNETLIPSDSATPKK